MTPCFWACRRPKQQDESFLEGLVNVSPRLDLLVVSNVTLTDDLVDFCPEPSSPLQKLSLAGCTGTYALGEMIAWHSRLLRIDLAGLDITNGELTSLVRACLPCCHSSTARLALCGNNN